MRRIRVTPEVWKGAVIGAATLVVFLVAYALLSFALGRAHGADPAEHAQTVTFLGAILLRTLVPAALVGGLLGAVARGVRKARRIKLVGAALISYFVVFPAAMLTSGDTTAIHFGVLTSVFLAPLAAPFLVLAAVILERCTRPGVPRDARG
ncbi:hypothetical protein [Polyangium sp. 15x6]|uniref:hypothetical protein n=1 Tax=Polyangium sp. 15x6 TaxID=3042687 RepID=UPI00249CB4A2|nr:hypothetical protein [Polyangium sp. 15x6]MDI3288996.1 hypothetical protein [Polyangium sp. 15x6]